MAFVRFVVGTDQMRSTPFQDLKLPPESITGCWCSGGLVGNVRRFVVFRRRSALIAWVDGWDSVLEGRGAAPPSPFILDYF